MDITVAQNAGFCFGVKKAVDKAYEMSQECEKAFTYGPIIHNSQVIEKLKNKGVDIIDDIGCIKAGERVIIRSHGISKEEQEAIKEKGAIIEDATCPYVKYIHGIVEEMHNKGYTVIIVGDPNHPEVKGVNGWCNNEAIIVNSLNDVYNINGQKKLCVVAQTTYNLEKWFMLLNEIVKLAKHIVIHNTICNATELRQEEAVELSKQNELMIVIGGKESSNSRKLYEICSKYCKKALFIEGEKELDLNELKNINRLGITAGASTPDYIVEGVVLKIMNMENVNTEEMEQKISEPEVSAEVEKQEAVEEEYTMEKFDEYNSNVYAGSIVEGRVILVTSKEVFVDIHYKSDGLLPLDEASYSEVNLEETFKVGDVIKVQVLKTNDGEGNVLLSRKAIEKGQYIEGIKAMKEDGTPVEVLITDNNKGGLDCRYGDIRAFMPLSLSGLHRDEDPAQLKGTKQQVLISEIKERRGEFELIVSRKEILKKERQQKIEEFLGSINEGDTCKGKVKSIIPVGAFISTGVIDIFVPISEIAWRRIGKPQDVLSEGQDVEVLIIKVNKEDRKITGSIKRMGKEPWEDFTSRFNEGDIIDVKIVRFAEFGAFAEIIDGVDGLIHISNIAEKHVNKPQDELKIGETVKAKIIKIENETKRVSLSLKDLEPKAEAAEEVAPEAEATETEAVEAEVAETEVVEENKAE